MRAGAIDCVLKGEGEASVADLLLRRRGRSRSPHEGARRRHAGRRRPAASVSSTAWTTCGPRATLLRHRRKYFIGVLDPCASIEFARGCPWDCAFCSAWTFYGRSYRVVSPERAVEDVATDQRAGHLHRRRRRLHPGEARARDRRGDRPPGHQEAVLPGNARRRAPAQQGGVPVLADAGAPIHVHRHRGDR